MESFMVVIKEFGFPVFVAGFLLVRIEPTLKHINVTLGRILQFLQDNGQIPKDAG
ncbi:MAG: YvrJ family protein [Phycisphaerae bacterium]|nr:YvrJ family protein [Phycisphaerae bacterium]